MEADDRLLSRFLEGDEQAFEELVRRYEARLRRLAFGLVRDTGLAEDIVQDTFIRAYRGASSIRRRGAVGSWLYRITLNRARDELRRAGRRRESPWEALDPAHPSARAPGTTEAAVESKEIQGQLRRALARMREEHRTPLVLREIEGMAYSEIAVLLGWPVGTVKTRIHRGRLELRSFLREPPGQTDR